VSGHATSLKGRDIDAEDSHSDMVDFRTIHFGTGPFGLQRGQIHDESNICYQLNIPERFTIYRRLWNRIAHPQFL